MNTSARTVELSLKPIFRLSIKTSTSPVLIVRARISKKYFQHLLLSGSEIQPHTDPPAAEEMNAATLRPVQTGMFVVETECPFDIIQPVVFSQP